MKEWLFLSCLPLPPAFRTPAFLSGKAWVRVTASLGERGFVGSDPPHQPTCSVERFYKLGCFLVNSRFAVLSLKLGMKAAIGLVSVGKNSLFSGIPFI